MAVSPLSTAASTRPSSPAGAAQSPTAQRGAGHPEEAELWYTDDNLVGVGILMLG